MTKPAIVSLLEAIEYPEEASPDALEYTLRVDDGEVEAVEEHGFLRLERVLLGGGEENEALAAKLATYAPGRILREGAVLAARRKSGEIYLWQEMALKKDMDARSFKRFFETFMNSCDWYLARIEDETSPSPAAFPNFTIRP